LNTRDRIRRRVLRGIALNRTPGFHFPGNFLDVSFDKVGRKGVRLSIAPGPWSADASGQTDLGALAILADLALGASIRAQLSRETRVATVSLSLHFPKYALQRSNYEDFVLKQQEILMALSISEIFLPLP
jgi:hypothetical protein